MLHGLRPSIDSLLNQCSSARQAKQIHAHLLLSCPPHSQSYLFARLISLYSRFNLIPLAISTFLSSSFPSFLLLNSILRALLSHSLPLPALSLYLRRRSPSSSPPDSFTLPLLIRACSMLARPALCSSIHAHALSSSFHSHPHTANELLSMYANIGRMDVARQLFDGIPDRTVLSWNMLLTGYASNLDCDAALDAFRLMEATGPAPNAVTWTVLLSAQARCRQHLQVVKLFAEMRGKLPMGECAPEAVAKALSSCAYLEERDDAVKKGKLIHGYVVRAGLEGCSFIRSSLISLYGKLGCGDEAETIFLNSAERSLVNWNALISSYAACGRCDRAYEVFAQLERSGEFEPDVVTWSALIKAFASAGMAEPSLDLFRRMQLAGVRANSITLVPALCSCAELAALVSGKEIHAHTVKSLMNRNVLVSNGLLNMYTKCGSLSYGRRLFDRMRERDLFSWNTMITGLGMHGLCDEALNTFIESLQSGQKPDCITFVALLSACSHAGRVSDGRRLFHLMVHEHGLSPAMEHYSCMVDMLGRAGLLREAREMIKGMPFKPNICVSGALLNACRIHGDAETAQEFVAAMGDGGLEGREGRGTGTGTGNFMMLSNIYAASGEWGESRRVRVMTRTRGLKKQTGQSQVEVGKRVYVFSAGGSLPLGVVEDVYGVVEDLCQVMESESSGDEERNALRCLDGELSIVIEYRHCGE